MPVEIMELIVRAHVQDPASGSSSSGSDESNSDAAAQKQTLVEECVEQVLEILRRRNER